MSVDLGRLSQGMKSALDPSPVQAIVSLISARAYRFGAR